MIEKLEFITGAALLRLIEDPRCETIGKHAVDTALTSTVCSDQIFDEGHSPWASLSRKMNIVRLRLAEEEFRRPALLAFVVEGDGVCALSWNLAGIC